MALINEKSVDNKEMEIRCATVNFFPLRGDTADTGAMVINFIVLGGN